MHRLLQLLGRFVQFSYACWDRIVLRGYYPSLQRPANIVHLFRDVGGEARITPAVLARRTASYRAWLESYAEQQGIPILTAPKGARKEEFVAPYYRSLPAVQGNPASTPWSIASRRRVRCRTPRSHCSYRMQLPPTGKAGVVPRRNRWRTGLPHIALVPPFRWCDLRDILTPGMPPAGAMEIQRSEGVSPVIESPRWEYQRLRRDRTARRRDAQARTRRPPLWPGPRSCSMPVMTEKSGGSQTDEADERACHS